MLSNIRITIVLLLVLSILTACQTFQHADPKKDKKVVAAGINIQLGMAYIDRHEIQRAKQKLLMAVHEAPQLPEAWYSMGYFFEITGEKGRARNCYVRALELAPKRGDTNNNYGTFLCRSRQYREAIHRFLVATQDVEYLDTASAYENAGLCAELIPDRPLAIRSFEAALRQDPARPTSLMGLAQVNYEQGHYNAANSYLNQFLIISPATSEAKALRAKLKKKGIES